jgi:phospholipid/cholesterol/gamma-HCH transport system substrate-binding protein
MIESKDTASSHGTTTPYIALPKRKFTVEFFVGLFAIAGLLCSAYLAVGLGDIKLFNSDSYIVYAEFDNISGIKNGASVEIGGVKIGEVTNISLKDPQAVLTLRIYNSVKLRDDDIASIRTKGIIGDRFVKISRGASDILVAPETTITQTESVVDFEDIVGKIVHSLTSSDKSESKE